MGQLEPQQGNRPGRVRRAIERVPGSSATQFSAALGLGAAATAGIGAPLGVWLVLGLLAVALALISALRYEQERRQPQLGRAHEPSVSPVGPTTADESLQVGNAIEGFFFTRADQKPKIGPDTPKDQRAQQRSKQMAHDLQTEDMYRARFDAPVARLVSALRERHDVPTEELEGVTNPTNRGEMYRVGETLQRLGRRARTNDQLERSGTLGQAPVGSASEGLTQPTRRFGRDRDDPLSLADLAERHAADVTALWFRWQDQVARIGPDSDEAFAQLSSEYQADHRVATRAVFRRLVQSGIADPRDDSLIKDPQDARGGVKRVAEVLDEAAERLRDPIRVRRIDEPRTANQLLNVALSQAIGLRSRVSTRPDEKLPFGDDPLFQWARRTYDLVRTHYAAYADDFYGEDPELGSGYFGMSFAFGIHDYGRSGYLERRIGLLQRIASETRPVAQPTS
jgi:hypothetical protein